MSAPQPAPALARRWRLALGAAGALALALGLAMVACNVLGSPPGAAPAPRAGDVPASWRAVRDSRGHRDHVVYGAVPCERCHGPSGFGRPEIATCESCHEQHTPLHPEQALGALAAPPTCVDCHSFSVDETPSEACMRCHREPQGLVTGAVGIHTPRAARRADDSTRPDSTRPDSTHPDSTAPDDSTRPDASAGAAAQRREPFCSDCHAPHQRPTLDPRPCASCHEREGQVRHAGVTGDRCESCHSVHEREHHAADGCVACHAAGGAAGARATVDAGRALFAGHPVCTGCHQPHRFDRASAAACRDCHDELPLLAEARAPAARGHRCASCHDNHDARAPKSCASCHASGPRPLTSNHPAVASRVDLGARWARGKARGGAADATSGATALPTRYGPPAPPPSGNAPAAACTGCHPIHDGKLAVAAGAAALPCASCHTGQVSHAPTAECATCHPPHGAAAPQGAALCATCHQDQAHSVAATGHADCQRCHTKAGHRPTQAPPRCDSCHREIAAVVRKGHDDCSACHRAAAHAPAQPVATCASCHAEVAASAPDGHQKCQSCHRPHDGTRLPQTECTSCHQDRVRGHGEPPSQSGRAALALSFTGSLTCGSCHRPHGPGGVAKPPECKQCHAPAGLPRLHRLRWHQANCANCHAAHEPTGRSDRDTCLACHKDRRAHEPSARSCATCHPFTE